MLTQSALDIEATLIAHDIRHVLVVRAKNCDDVVVRLQSDPILKGVPAVSSIAATLHNFGENISILGRTIVVFHYNDVKAVSEVRRLSKMTDTIPVCLGSDIQNFKVYLHSHEFTEIYTVPTLAHQQVLAGQIERPVVQLDEAVDIIGCRDGTKERGLPQRRLLWFGYAESFAKSMATLVPKIEAAKRSGVIDQFSVMTDEHRFANRFGLQTIPYDICTFWNVAQSFDYCILSHLPLDLNLNTYIKSPNKAITAIMAGLIPIATATPAYSLLLKSFGLEQFLFSSASDLTKILSRLDPESDRAQVQQSDAVSKLMLSRSDNAIAEAFLEIVAAYLDGGRVTGPVSTPLVLEQVQPKTGFKEHVRDLFPSLIRAFKLRLHSSR